MVVKPDSKADGPSVSFSGTYDALVRLGYGSGTRTWDAAFRLLRAPDVARDLVTYVEKGAPAIDYHARTPADLFRALPGGYSVAVLIRDFDIPDAGAFLVAANLVLDPGETEKILNTIVQDGYRITGSDGKPKVWDAPVSMTYPHCPVCGTVLIHRDDPCPECSLVIGAEASVGGRPSSMICPSCSRPVPPGAKFCRECGRKLDPGSRCRACGAWLSPGARFCRECGSRTV